MRAETGRAVLAATNLAPRRDAPPLSALVGRVVAARSLLPDRAVPVAPAPARHLALVTPTPGLVSPPPAPRQLPAPPPSALTADGRCALLAAHGGAGVTCLLRAGLADAGAVDAGRVWPARGPVLLVARTSTSGLEWTRDAARAHAAGVAGLDLQLLGLVLVADAPGRLPSRVAALADLVAGAFPHVWQVPWLTEWRLAAASEPLPAHPEVARLITDLRALTGAGPATRGDSR